MKYILVSGGVISGLGKGIVSCSIGAILTECNVPLCMIKIDPYLNIDAGTFSPYEHGEVYILNDGGEVDLDLGHYERFCDLTLTSDNNITSGKIYHNIINKERHGDYLGQTVQVVPHMVNSIETWIKNVALKSCSKDGKTPEVCIIELGGTTGDIEGMAFFEAFRHMQFHLEDNNFCSVHVSLLPETSNGEIKTKPTQHSIKSLLSRGLQTDILVLRSRRQIHERIPKKLANLCQVRGERIICLHDVDCLYKVPIMIEQQGLINMLNTVLESNFTLNTNKMSKWEDLLYRSIYYKEMISIGLVGKYTKLSDTYKSVLDALQSAALHMNYKVDIILIESKNLVEKIDKPGKTEKNDTNEDIESIRTTKCTKNRRLSYSDPSDAWKALKACDGVLVPGGFGDRGILGKINAIQYARTNDIPFLGICLGLQCAVIEFARNELHLTDANSIEFDFNTQHPVVIEMLEYDSVNKGGTMRLGLKETIFNEPCYLQDLYGSNSAHERHRHRYEVNQNYVEQLESKGMKFVGKNKEGNRMEILSLKDHPYFYGVQYHPEFLSKPNKPSPPFLGLIKKSIEYQTKKFS
ncbi:hypothetical protein A3Q56_06698 [Intoshia linei]|uniref:CTP synthase n=1 Tax=Intoshia linei TaxID=1819745 RepID=A0A177AW48_9BILA|nr:hypothetical protein A3Q56_06698 [Intoshia linei]